MPDPIINVDSADEPLNIVHQAAAGYMSSLADGKVRDGAALARLSELQQHLPGPGKGQAGPDQGPDSGGFQRLGMQAGEDPPAGGVGQQPVQRLAGPQPVCPAIAPRDQDGGGGGRRAAGGLKSQAAAQVEVTLR